ncbi:phosphatase PAP2 family protein [Pseudomonas sp. H2_D10]
MPSPPVAPASKPLDFRLYLGIPAAAALALLLLELTPLDMALAKRFYNAAEGGFVGRYSFLLEDILHDRAKQLVILFSVMAILGFVGTFILQRLKPYRRELGCLVLSLGLATAFVSPLKTLTGVQCPWSLKEFGGEETYSTLLSHRPATDKPGRCWPGGHAATGFALFALFFALRDRKPRMARYAFLFATGLGSIFSVSRMLQGAHFFSHNVWTAIFCWLICLGLYGLLLYRPSRPLAPR